MKKKALITGITGQDGSYLSELLLSKDYEVYGIIRRSSSFNTERIDHIYQDPHETGRRLHLVYGDLNDASSLNKILRDIKPDEIYNLGAQSHVRVSFDIPEYTAEVGALGTLRLLEAIRDTGINTKFYQASSSELYGKVQEIPQKETTPFYPRSPYAAAKLYAYWITVNYRESYGIFACNGILFNHECIASNTPLIVRKEGTIDITTPEDLVPLLPKGKSVQNFEVPGVEIWDGQQWTQVKAITATRRRVTDPSHVMLSIEARAGVVEVTAHHHMLDEQLEIRSADQIKEGSRVALAKRFPESPGWTTLTEEMSEFLGLMVAEGHVPAKAGKPQFTNKDERLRQRVADLWRRLFLGTATTYYSISGWNGDAVGQLYLNGVRSLTTWLREQLYTSDGYKRVPPLVLNAPLSVQTAFLQGYYAGDGLQAGNGNSIKTNSAVLAQGLNWLYWNQGRQCSVYAEHRGERTYYQLNIASDQPFGGKGQHLRREPAEVRKVIVAENPTEWVFDLETESQRFCAGVGRIIVHNSPRRGETFVTRKVTKGAAAIKLGLQDKLYLGNLDAKRDWGFAGDYVEAMWLMLQQDKPTDFVIATGETHSIRELLDEAFGHVGLDWHQYVEIDSRYYRPAEVDLLIGDATKAKTMLGWEPKVKFKELVQMMVDADLAALQTTNPLKANHNSAI